jgi:cation diffusion facilitator CzcD-associated flavoprotein CzcO
VLKTLLEAGLEVEALERGATIGGNWAYGELGSACYASLHANTSRRRMQYADHPMPADERHALEVDAEDYKQALRREHRRGRGRARRAAAPRRLPGGARRWHPARDARSGGGA